MDKKMITGFDEVRYLLICMPDFVEAPPADDSLGFDGILAELETGTAYGLIPWWLAEDERIGQELCSAPWLW